METFACIDTVHNHTGHFADTAFWVLLHDSFHIVDTTFRIPVVEFAKTADKQKLVTIGSIWKSITRDTRISLRLTVSASFESLVGGCV